jgi:hypothetical protein
VDEDTWFMLMADNYDSRGELWRTSVVNYFYAYEMNTWQAGVGLYHDLNAGTYLAFNLVNEQPGAYKLNQGKFTERDFGPGPLGAWGSDLLIKKVHGAGIRG